MTRKEFLGGVSEGDRCHWGLPQRPDENKDDELKIVPYHGSFWPEGPAVPYSEAKRIEETGRLSQ